jgi:hypothetical protein
MKTINMSLLFSGLLVTFILSGCQGPEPIHLYPGPKLPRSEVAILKIQDARKIGDNRPEAKIQRRPKKFEKLIIDGKDVLEDVLSGKPSWPHTYHAAILPGKHEISWRVSGPYQKFYYWQMIRDVKFYLGVLSASGTLNAKAGKTYEIHIDFRRPRTAILDNSKVFNIFDAWTPHQP